VSEAQQAAVRAAGCVVWRRVADGIEVLLVHRPPPHDDWSLPKGKLEPGERHRDAAVREVHEETGVRGDLGPELGEVCYPLPSGADKRVRWWALEATVDDGFTPNDEVDRRRWVPLERVADLLTWPTDRHVVELFTLMLP
jgi:8-oxo-dGTP pyrophosphatase MutT (NUDIX family)